MVVARTFTLDQKTIKKLKEISVIEEKSRSELLRDWINEKHSVMKKELRTSGTVIREKYDQLLIQDLSSEAGATEK